MGSSTAPAVPVAVRSHIRFLLNGEEVRLDSVAPDATLLDFLRLDRALKGTKEGCAEGDCGACTVLVGRLTPDGLVYEGVNACIRFLASLDATHVVTVEHLKRPDGSLHPVQQALVDSHGSQCGFCTPGFVMSLYALWMRDPHPDNGAIEQALQGNLCRCTGYEPIVRAAKAVSSHGDVADDPLVAERSTVIETLSRMRDGARVEIGGDGAKIFLPASADDLAGIYAAHPQGRIVAGSTDVGLWVTKHMRDISPAIFIGRIDELRSISVSDETLIIGANVSYTDALVGLSASIPAFKPLLQRIGGDQVRNMGTVGGNIANGSPIGDMPPALIALDAQLVLRKGGARRTIPLESFFIEYGKQDRQPGEFVEAIRVPLAETGDRIAFHKITKRRDEDITAVMVAFRLRLDAEGIVKDVRVACGGMAGIPRRASSVEAALKGKLWSRAAAEEAMQHFEDDFTPLTDMRATAQYRMTVAKNLLLRFWLETTGTRKPISVKREHAA